MDRGRRRLRSLAAPALLVAGLVLFAMGNAIGGLALLAGAWFARTAARAGRRQEELAGLLYGLTVGEVMERDPLVVVPQATLDTFASSLGEADGATVARVMRGDDLLGLVGPREVDRVPRGRWAAVHAEEAMVATDGLPQLDPGEPLGPAAGRLADSEAPGLPVVSDGRVAGILTRFAVGRTLDERVEAVAARRGRR